MKKLQSRHAAVYLDRRPSTSWIQVLQTGLAFHQAGSIAQAIEYYESVLAMEPDQPDALNLLGVVALGAGQVDRAIDLCGRAVDASPAHAGALCNLGNALFGASRFKEAITFYERAFAIQPGDAELLYNLANATQRVGDLMGALAYFDRALEIDPLNCRTLLNRGTLLATLGRLGDSVADLQKANILSPLDPGILNHLGIALANEKRTGEAEALFRAFLSENPENGQTQNNLAALLIQSGRLSEARGILERTVILEPSNGQAWRNLAISIPEKEILAAVEAARQATQLDPTSAEGWALLGNLELKRGEAKASMVYYERALEISPGCLDNDNNFGLTCSMTHNLEKELAFYDRRLQREPQDPIALADGALAYLNSGQLGKAIDLLTRSVEIDPSNEYAHSNLLLVQTYSPDFPAERQFLEAKEWARLHAGRPTDKRVSAGIPKDKLRIGYLSADFHEHPAGRFLNSMFPHHDRNRYEVVVYANQSAADEVTREIVQSVDEWRIVKKLDDSALAATIERDGIDILVDLLGHTPNHRLKAFALKPAPVQVTWLGYFGTTGMSQMDFILADPWVLPPEFEPYFSERPARMDGCLYVFQPPNLNIEVGSSPLIRNGHITFGCFNNPAKITPEVVALWSRVLLAQPESKMLLNRWPYKSETVRKRYLDLFASAGVNPERIEFRSTSGQEVYYQSHQDVDVMLDSFPFGGGTTTMEALWMGVPIVSMSTGRFAGRMTESIYNAVGLEDMITRSESEYVALACNLAEDPAKLQNLRLNLRSQVENSSLCDLAGYTRRLESAFEWMWENR